MKVRRPTDAEIGKIKAGAGFASLLEPYGDRAVIDKLASAKIDAVAMEFIPRISRAQSMDALSSQANLAGYRSVIEAAGLYGRAFPMMMTAAGTVAAAGFHHGRWRCGFAGDRYGTPVLARLLPRLTYVLPLKSRWLRSVRSSSRSKTKEFKQAETAAGYAKAMSAEYQAKQAALVTEHIAKQDIVITTALIPGRAAPVLVTEAQAKSMRPGSVIIDLAVAQGGNCPLSKPDELVDVNGVKIMGFTNLPAPAVRCVLALCEEPFGAAAADRQGQQGVCTCLG